MWYNPHAWMKYYPLDWLTIALNKHEDDEWHENK